MSQINVMLVDDHAVVRMGFKLLLESAPDIKVVAEAESGEQAIRAFGEETAWEFSQALSTVVETHIKSSFAEIKEKLYALRGSLDETQRRLSEDREHLVQCQAAMGEYV